MNKKDEELLNMMKNFKLLNSKEQGFILGLTEGLVICKTRIIKINEMNSLYVQHETKDN